MILQVLLKESYMVTNNNSPRSHKIKYLQWGSPLKFSADDWLETVPCKVSQGTTILWVHPILSTSDILFWQGIFQGILVCKLAGVYSHVLIWNSVFKHTGRENKSSFLPSTWSACIGLGGKHASVFRLKSTECWCKNISHLKYEIIKMILQFLDLQEFLNITECGAQHGSDSWGYEFFAFLILHVKDWCSANLRKNIGPLTHGCVSNWSIPGSCEHMAWKEISDGKGGWKLMF